MKIERPDWKKICYQNEAFHLYLNELDKWFDTHIEPINKMLSEGVEVAVDKTRSGWHTNKTPFGQIGGATHKALLINIEPIKRETREEQLEKFVMDFYTTSYDWPAFKKRDKFLERAKALLEKK